VRKNEKFEGTPTYLIIFFVATNRITFIGDEGFLFLRRDGRFLIQYYLVMFDFDMNKKTYIMYPWYT
jgi:hypothetical protein